MTDPDALPAAANLAGAKVACIGDLMLDRFVYGAADRISAEAPVPVLRVGRETVMLGGAGNVFRNLATIGAAPSLIALVGEDDAGRTVARLLDNLAGEVTLLHEADRPTTIKTRFIAGGQQLLRTDLEETAPAQAATHAAIEEHARRLLPQVGALIISDYGKGMLGPAVLQHLIAAARDARTPVIVDPKGQDYGIYRGADLITPNRAELEAAASQPVGSDEEVVAAARYVVDACGINNVLVTRGPDGMSFVTRDGDVAHLPTVAQEVFDVSGAGDTVVAIVGAALAAGLPFPVAMRLANAAAGRVVGKVGTAAVLPDELDEALQPGDHNKIVDRSQLAERVNRWRAEGRRIGFTNGCFDLIHPGHVALLAWARNACDRLVIGVNDDASVRRLKGKDRPVQTVAARERVLASLASVDLVVRFGEDTPLALIETMRPDVLVKGADYTVDQVVGASFVQSYGGEVKLAPLEPGHSTTATIARANGDGG